MLFRKGQKRARTIGTHSSCFVGCLWAPLYVIHVLHRRMIGCMPTIQHRQGMRQCEASMRLKKGFSLRKVINKNIGVTEEPHTNSSIRLLKYRHRFSSKVAFWNSECFARNSGFKALFLFLREVLCARS